MRRQVTCCARSATSGTRCGERPTAGSRGSRSVTSPPPGTSAILPSPVPVPGGWSGRRGSSPVTTRIRSDPRRTPAIAGAQLWRERGRWPGDGPHPVRGHGRRGRDQGWCPRFFLTIVETPVLFSLDSGGPSVDPAHPTDSIRMGAITAESPEVTRATPVSEAQRLRLIDALRGVALLGILLMNIPGFAMPNYFSESFRSDPKNVNFWVSEVISVLFEGKMRALFGMVFGAGVLLFVMKKEQTGKPVTGLFYRRMFWLVVFGLIHAHLILWIGDILYLYGICGMLVYLFRNVNPKYLVLGVPLVAVVDFTASTLFYQDIRAKRIAYVEASAAAAEGKTLTEEQDKALAAWREIEKSLIPNREDAKENTRKMKSDYSTVAGYLRPLAFKMET